MDEQDFLNVSTRCKSFADLTPEVVRLIFDRCHEQRFDPGSTLMREGERGDCLMVLLEGTASATSHDFRGDPRIATLHEFDVLGEMALITGQTRTVDVVADTQVRALVLDIDEFQNVATEHPEMGMVLTHLMAERLGAGPVDALGGKRIERYRVLRCAGRGSMAIVYKATEDERVDPVALKMMSHRLVYEPGAMARFQREAEILKTLDHPAIARIQRQFSAYRTSFIAMEFCDGPDLSTLLKRTSGYSESEVRKMAGQIGGALGYMHERNVIHRDLKPSNVMSTMDGRIKLTDFGLAKPVETAGSLQITRSNASLTGTPLYMAPEQLSNGKATKSTDVYAFGCLTYELLTGKPAFGGKTLLDLAQQKQSFEMPPRGEIGSGISAEMHAMLSGCLTPSAEERHLDFELLRSWAGPVAVF